MTKPMITIHNVETGEANALLRDQQIAAKAAEKAALLAQLGITADQAKLLLS